jgi:hypothetical protein
MTRLIEKLREIVKEIETEKGPLTFAAVVERQESPGMFDFVLSAPWINDNYEFYTYLSPKFKRDLTREEWGEFARTTAIDPEGDFLEDFYRVVGHVTKEENIRNLRIANVDVRYAHLFPTHAANLSYA